MLTLTNFIWKNNIFTMPTMHPIQTTLHLSSLLHSPSLSSAVLLLLFLSFSVSLSLSLYLPLSVSLSVPVSVSISLPFLFFLSLCFIVRSFSHLFSGMKNFLSHDIFLKKYNCTQISTHFFLFISFHVSSCSSI